MESRQTEKAVAYRFIVLLGMVSLFGDITYEGARAVTGPYLASLGAGAAAVGLVAGLGEFSGYALRLASGYFADRTRAYWKFTLIGYCLILSIPMLMFVGRWQVAAALIILERMGKAIRTPSRDAILSHATKRVGRGLGFGLHEALDQAGAVIGPLVFTAALLLKGGYRSGFAVLWIPGVLTLIFLLRARREVPLPEKMEAPDARFERGGLPRIFWLYALFAFLSVMGFANFQLVSYHFKSQSVISETLIPVFYITAMAVDGVIAIPAGRLYDRSGMAVLAAVPLLAIPLPFFAFSGSFPFALIGVVLWGAVMGVHETVMRAAIADLVPVGRRGVAYGIFNAVYGGSFLIGSALMGLLYGVSIGYLILFAVSLEIMSLVAFFYLVNEGRKVLPS